MKERPLVSVLVPVYNAGDYLHECLDSIIDQAYTNLEILLVDDGSTDGSSEVCDEYSGRDYRMRVIHQENMGAAAARRNAVIKSTGDYICFVDADDMISSDMVAYFVENIGECDLITSGCRCEDAPRVYNERVDSFEAGIYNTDERIRYFIANMIAFQNRFEDGILPFIYNKMYKADIMKDVVMDIDPAITYAEDRDLLFRYVLKAKGIRVTHEMFYDYRYRKESIMRNINERFMSDLNHLYLSLSRAFRMHPQKDELMRQLQLFITSRIYSITYYMGFPADTGISAYAFPFTDLNRESRVILYGAGKVGLAYYRQIYRRKLAEMVLWVDSDWKKYGNSHMPIESPEGIQNCDFDYIIIGVKKKEVADGIREDLASKGVPEEKILWRIPAVF